MKVQLKLFLVAFYCLTCFLSGFSTAQEKLSHNLNAIDGFEVEKIYAVPKREQGSWISLTNEKDGRLITSNEKGKLYRLTIPESGPLTAEHVEKIDLEIGPAQGLLYAFDSLYVMVNMRKGDKSGLYRMTDTDGDDKYDSFELLQKLEGGGEHGPHAILMAPDGKGLYILGGNHTKPPPLASSAAKPVWQEDLLLPRMWDANGHAKGILAPGGWICHVDKNGKNAKLVANGFRNQYDAAFDANGEMFTYDSDMEWDVGLPWYRPTRILHCTSGAEFGWRSGSGKWPEYYPDSLPSVVDIGPGSPTGVVFGTGASFPDKYQRALFAADWSYGKLYAIHMEPAGGSYRGTAESVVWGAPFPITDLVVRSTDGALYVTTGGRGVDSGLFRISAENGSTEASKVELNDIAKTRRKMESFHGGGNLNGDTPRIASALEFVRHSLSEIIPNLSHEDRHVRFAARVALEQIPPEAWIDRILDETEDPDLWQQINGVIALARVAGDADPNRLVAALGNLPADSMDDEQMLGALRACGLVMARGNDRISDETRGGIADTISALYPSGDWRMNRELCNLMVAAKSPDAVEKTLELLKTARTNEDRVHFLTCLRNPDLAWGLNQRREYLNHFVDANRNFGGHSYGAFIKRILDEAVKAMPEFAQVKFADVIAAAKEPPAETQPEPRAFVKQWTVDELVNEINAVDSPDSKNGLHLFTAASCTNCHRHSGFGGIMGPDLTAVRGRFNLPDLISSMVEPSKNISDQYQMTNFELKNGKVVTGRIVNLHSNTYRVMPDMNQPDNLTIIKTGQVESMEASPTSAMPSGLLDTFSAQEVADLVAYLRGE